MGKLRNGCISVKKKSSEKNLTVVSYADDLGQLRYIEEFEWLWKLEDSNTVVGWC